MGTLLEQIEQLSKTDQHTFMVQLLRRFAHNHSPKALEAVLAECGPLHLIEGGPVKHPDLTPEEFRQGVYQGIEDYVKELAQRTEYQRPAATSVAE